MRLSKILCAMFVFAAPLGVGAVDYSLPAANQGDWEPGVDIGVIGGIDQYLPGGASERTTLIDVTQAPYNADNTGVTNSRTAITSAIAAATTGQVVYFPNGTYLVEGGGVLINKDNITIRGESRDGVTIKIDNPGSVGFLLSPGGGVSGDNEQTVTGTKTKGTTALSVSDESAFNTGDLCFLFAENEEDNTAIQAGANPTFTVFGYRERRQHLVKVTSTAAGVININPSLPADYTNYALRISRSSTSGNKVENVGIESLTITNNDGTSNHFEYGIDMLKCENTWIYDVKGIWQQNDASGSIVRINNCFNVEVRKCYGLMDGDYLADGFVQTRGASNFLAHDNTLINFDIQFYDAGPLTNSAYLHNFIIGTRSGSTKCFFLGHTGNPIATTLLEGNVSGNYQVDGFYNSNANGSFHRNWFHGTNVGQTLNGYTLSILRFGRDHANAFNVFGFDGVSDEVNSFGNPNLGNPFFDGTSQMSAGDFPQDWQVTGTLTTRTSDTEGIFAMSGGDFTNSLVDGNIWIWWNSYANNRQNMDIALVDGSNITLSGGTGDVLPSTSTVVNVYFGTQGYQERDLDVEASTEMTHNYHAVAAGTGAIENSTTDTMVNSFAYTAQPSWWTDDGFTGTWPPVNPNSPPTNLFNVIPAGYRYAQENGLLSGAAYGGRLRFNGTGSKPVLTDQTGSVPIKTN